MFSGQLIELLSLSIEDPADARKLVEIVGGDYALTLGAGTVQNLASSLACFQSSEQRPVILQHLMMRSMVSAQVAAVTAEISEFRDREVTYLAGMLQNLGARPQRT